MEEKFSVKSFILAINEISNEKEKEIERLKLKIESMNKEIRDLTFWKDFYERKSEVSRKVDTENKTGEIIEMTAPPF